MRCHPIRYTPSTAINIQIHMASLCQEIHKNAKRWTRRWFGGKPGAGGARGASAERPQPELPEDPSHGSFHPHEAAQITAPAPYIYFGPTLRGLWPFCLGLTGCGLVETVGARSRRSPPGGCITGMLCIGPPSWKACRPDADAEPPSSSPQSARAHVQLPDWEVRPPSVPQIPGQDVRVRQGASLLHCYSLTAKDF